MKAIHPFTVGLATLLAACSPAGEDPVVEETPDASLMVPTPDQQFVATIAASDQYEIEAGRLAQELGTSQAVKDFGLMMVDDHLKSTMNLRTALELVTPPIPVNSVLSPAQEEKLQQLRDAGEGFDTLYAEDMVAKHEERLATLRDFAANGGLAELKAFAATGAETTAGHLEQARELP